MFAKNVEAFLGLLLGPARSLRPDFADEVLAGSLLTRDGTVVHAPTRDALAGGK